MILGDAPFFVTHFMPIAIAAKRRGTMVHIATPIDPGSGRGDEAALQRIRDEGFIYHHISLKRAGTNPTGEIALIRELNALIGVVQPDVMHLFGLKPILYAGGIARLKRLAAVHAVIGLGLPFMQQGLRAALQRLALKSALGFVFANRASRITVENEMDGDVVRSTRAVEPARMTRLNGAGVDLDAFHPRENSAQDEAPVIMFAARLIAPKGVYDFIEAAKRIKARGVAGRFVFQCQLDLRNRQAVSEEEVLRWQDEGIAEWWGASSDMPNALRKADIFCLPTYYREGLPKVLIEAAASGLPIVTCDMPGCADVVEHGKSGYLIAPRDVDALEVALLSLIQDTDLRRRAGARSRRIAEEKFSVERLIETSLGLYEVLWRRSGGKRQIGQSPADDEP